jgi:hypothetical protein
LGDIAYIGDGVDQITETDYGAAVNLGSDGTPSNPKALLVYPGATCNVGNAALERAFHVWNGDTGSYSVHWVISKFRLTTAGVGVTAQVGYYVTGDNWVYNNLVVNAGLGPEWDDPSYHTGIRINTGHEAITQTAVYFYNNTLYGNGWSGAVFPGETGSLLFDPGALARSTTVDFSNNIIYSTGEPYLAGESAALSTGDYLNCWYGDGAAPAWDTTAVNDDPDFIGTGVFNFQLQNGSLCQDAGKNVSTVVARDILGVSRPQGLAFDLGAYEYITGTVAMSQTVFLPLMMH